MIIKFAFISFVFFVFCTSCLLGPQIQNERLNNANSKEDKLGIPITQAEFDKLIEGLMNKVNNTNYLVDTTFYIQFVRTVNTIDKNKWFVKYDYVKKVYYENVYKNALVVLDAGFYKGGAFYCFKYNLFIGGPPDSNSQFRIIP